MSGKNIAILIPFFRYTPHVSEHYRIYFERFLQTYDLDIPVYIIDGDMGISSCFSQSSSDFTVIKQYLDKSHWGNVKKALKEIPERYILLLDQDVIFNNWSVVEGWFELAKEGKLVSGFDNSGPIMDWLGMARIAPYYTIFDKEKMGEEYDFAPVGKFDSFGSYTLEVLGKYDPKDIVKLPDPRNSTYFNGDCDEDYKSPYYHIRNGNLGIYLITTKKSENHQEDYRRCIEITPKREALRLLAWVEMIDPSLNEDILPVLEDLNMTPEDWNSYIKECRRYHNV